MIFIPFILQGLVMTIDEFYFHRRRGLPAWEKWGHPLDTLTVMACFSILTFMQPSLGALKLYAVLSVFSCLFITKDEFIHKEFASGGENWLHSLLFVLHPIVFIFSGYYWWVGGAPSAFLIQSAVLAGFLAYQIFYWNVVRAEKHPVNNEHYDEMQEVWYTAQNHPVALLRSENRLKSPWVDEEIRKHFGKPCKVLDIGCGAGFLTNQLALKGHDVTGVDLSASSLEVAAKYDATKNVKYKLSDGTRLPFEDATFDAVCAMDLLEHVEDPRLLMTEAKRVLKPGGLLFFHTFNRNFLSWLIIIKAVEWFVKNTPAHMHVYHLFIKPQELLKICKELGLKTMDMKGIQPDFKLRHLKALFTRVVPTDLEFHFTRSLVLGYAGYTKK